MSSKSPKSSKSSKSSISHLPSLTQRRKHNVFKPLRRKIFFIAHAVAIEIAIIHSYKMPKRYSHVKRPQYVKFFGLQLSSSWATFAPKIGGKISARSLTQALGISHPIVRSHNPGNDAALTMFCLFRRFMRTRDDDALFRRGTPLPTFSFPHLHLYITNIEQNNTHAEREKRNADPKLGVFHQNDIETSQVATGIITQDQRSIMMHGKDRDGGLARKPDVSHRNSNQSAA